MRRACPIPFRVAKVSAFGVAANGVVRLHFALSIERAVFMRVGVGVGVLGVWLFACLFITTMMNG